MNKKLNSKEGCLVAAVGGLAYIPSEVVVYKLERARDDESGVPTEHATLSEPAIVPLISVTPQGNMAKVYYNGSLWWADSDDLYEVEEYNDY